MANNRLSQPVRRGRNDLYDLRICGLVCIFAEDVVEVEAVILKNTGAGLPGFPLLPGVSGYTVAVFQPCFTASQTSQTLKVSKLPSLALVWSHLSFGRIYWL